MKNLYKFFVLTVCLVSSISTFAQNGEFITKLINPLTLSQALHQKDVYGLGANDSLSVFKDEKDQLGYTHYRLHHYYKKILVEGSDIILHEKEGRIVSFNGRYVKGLQLEVTPVQSIDDCLVAATSHYSKEYSVPADSIVFHQFTKLVITKNYTKGDFSPENFKLCYKFVLRQKSNHELLVVFINVEDKEVCNAYPLTYHCNGLTGNTTTYGNQSFYGAYYSGSYKLKDDCNTAVVWTRDFNGGARNLEYSYSSTSWGSNNSSALTSHFILKRLNEYWPNYHSRNTWNGSSNGGLLIYNNATFGGSGNNASFTYLSATSGEILVGGGNTSAASDDFNTSDILGHELTHGVTASSAGLIYSGESGALNESFSDIFGTASERFIEQSMTGFTVDWTIGEDRGTPFRSLANPKLYYQPNTKGGTYWVNTVGCTPSSSNDYCGVHTNSGPLNYVYYLMCVGGSGTNDNGYSYTVTGFGTNNASKIAYRALTTYLTSSGTYGDARNAFIASALDLYGSSSTQYTSTVAAWCAVGMGNTCGNSCTYSLSKSSQNYGAAGGSDVVQITTSTGCSWTASSNQSWISISSSTSGSGNGTISYSLAVNTSASIRNGSITVSYSGGTKVLTITQDAGTASCTYTISKSTQNFPETGGNDLVQITTSTGCSWISTSNQSWITISSGTSGTGNGTISYSLAVNTSASIRNGSITVSYSGGTQVLTITQDAGTALCTYTISKSAQNFPETGGNDLAQITTSTGCSWTATSDQSWLLITSGSSGNGSSNVSFSASANTTLFIRHATITINYSGGSKSLSISQDASICQFLFSKSSQTFGAAGGSDQVQITSTSGCSWTTSSDQNWLTITSGTSGVGAGTVYYSVSLNSTSSNRMANLTLTFSGGSKVLIISQDAASATCTFALSKTTQVFSQAGGSDNVYISTNSGNCSWTSSSDQSWLTITSGGAGIGDGTINYSALQNSSSSSRTGNITLTFAGGSKVISVSQAGSSICNYDFNSSIISFDAVGGTYFATVIAGDGCPWTLSVDQPWVQIITGTSGTGTSSFVFKISKNITAYPRMAVVTLKYASGSEIMVFNQYAPDLSNGINNIQKSNPGFIYPNPASDHCKIIYNESINAYRIVDANGRTIVEKTSFSKNPETIDTSLLMEGVYVVQFYSDNLLITTQKLLIIK